MGSENEERYKVFVQLSLHSVYQFTVTECICIAIKDSVGQECSKHIYPTGSLC